ncbi:MAG: DUF2961 domain-containing protein [Phycisphaerae bacterium]|jgi:hypothetical protein
MIHCRPLGRSAALLGLLSAALASAAHAQRTISQAELLARVVDLDRLARPPAADERAGTVVVARGREISAGADGWETLANIDAPGAITRIWVDKPEGSLQLTIDGQPTLECDMTAFFDGGVEPFGEPFTYRLAAGGAAVSYFPISFASRCSLRTRGFPGTCEIDFTTFGKDDAVEPFTPSLSAEAHEALERAAATLKDGLAEQHIAREHKLSSIATRKDVKAGQSLTETIDRPGTIRWLAVALTDRAEPREAYALHRCVLRIHFDGQAQPAVEAPLSAFFGSGFERNPLAALPAGTERLSSMPSDSPMGTSMMYCALPMPFAKSARIEIENRTRRKIGLLLYLRVERDAPPPNALRFHAQFRRASPLRAAELELLDVRGRGRWIGATLLVDSPVTEWWGDGGMRVALDGGKPARSPADLAAWLGTATPPAPGTHGLHGVGAAAPYGKSTAYRWMVGDNVPFHRALRVTLGRPAAAEHADLYLGAVTYWYADADTTIAYAALTDEELKVPPLRVPGAVEIEGNIAGEGWGHVIQQRQLGAVELSGEAAASVNSGQTVRIALPCKQTGHYRVSLRVPPGRSFQPIAVSLEGGPPIGAATYSRREDGIHYIGEVDLAAGQNTLVVTCPRNVLLDCWVLEPVGADSRPVQAP